MPFALLLAAVASLFAAFPAHAEDFDRVAFLRDAVAPGLGATISLDSMPQPPLIPAELPPRQPAATPQLRGNNLPPKKLRPLIQQVAREQQLDPQLLHAVIAVESGYDSEARSPKGAQGLMQLMPDTAARFGVRDAFDPLQNIRGGARYLRWLQGQFKQDLHLVIAAYNAGEGAVSRYRNTIPPYPETRDYVNKVLARYRAGQLPQPL